MKTINKKVLRTRQALRDSLCLLLESESIHNITVSQLCRAADINRTTFYKYYALPIDILSEYIEELCEQTMSQVRRVTGASRSSALYQMMYDFCVFYYRNQQLTRIYIECTRDVLPILQKTLGLNSGDYFKNNYANCFISGGVTSLVVNWGMNGYQESPDDIAGKLTRYILSVEAADRPGQA